MIGHQEPGPAGVGIAPGFLNFSSAWKWVVDKGSLPLEFGAKNTLCKLTQASLGRVEMREIFASARSFR